MKRYITSKKREYCYLALKALKCCFWWHKPHITLINCKQAKNRFHCDKAKISAFSNKKSKNLVFREKNLKTAQFSCKQTKNFFSVREKEKTCHFATKKWTDFIFREIRLKTALFSANKGEHVFGAIKLK